MIKRLSMAILIVLIASMIGRDADASDYGEWGFKGFEVPPHEVELHSGGNLQDAMNTLRAQGGGTLKLQPGTYFTNQLWIPSNVVISGAGVGKTVIKSNGPLEVLRPDRESANIIFRNFTVDASGNTGNGIDIAYGVDNVLVEDVEVFGAGKSNIIVWNRDNAETSNNITIRSVKVHGAKLYHGVAGRIVKNMSVSNIEAWDNGGYGIDVSTSDFVEVDRSYVHDNKYGTKFPLTNHLYMHDNRIEDNGEVGIKMKRLSADPLYHHYENNVVKNCVGGAVEWPVDPAEATFAEFVARGNVLSGNLFNYFRIRGGKAYSFGDPNATGPANDKIELVVRPLSEDPASLGVGYTTW
jgi:hypothetical protein